jgi:hypothetical protein
MMCQLQTNMPGAEGWNPLASPPKEAAAAPETSPLLALAVAAVLILILFSGGEADDAGSD